MSQAAVLAAVLLASAFGCVLGALRCLADRLLPSAAIYTVLACALVGGAVVAAIDAL